MSTAIQRRRGTTAQHASFAGLNGELTVDTDKEVVVVHDGATAGGYPMMRENGSNSALALGSAATPSLKFTGDPNTGIYSPGADQVAISTGGSGRLFVDASGNVGVGANPSQRLSVFSGSAAGINNVAIFKGGGSSSGNGAGIILSPDSANTYATWYGSRIATAFGGASWGCDLIFSTNNNTADSNLTERLRITSAGLVGVGTNSPGSNLDLAGTTSRIRWDVNNAYTLATHGNAAFSAFAPSVQSAADFQYQISGIEKMRLDSSGRLGVGTSDPGFGTSSYYDDLVIRNATSASGAGITIQSNSTNGFSGLNLRKAAGDDLGKFVADASNGKVYIESAGTTAITIDSSQRVGIGTTSPSLKFVVSNGGAAGLEIDPTANASAPSILSYNRSGAAYTRLTYDALEHVFLRSGSEAARIDSSSRLLVGTSSSASSGDGQYCRLQVRGNTYSSAGGGIIALERGEAATSITTDETLGAVLFTDSAGNSFAEITAQADNNAGAGDYPGRLVFSTTADGASSPTERMRITSGGQTQWTNAITPVLRVENSNNVSGDGVADLILRANAGNTSSYHLRGNTNTVGNWYLYGNGTTSYSSDQRLKKNIETTRDGYLADICQLRVVKYNWNSHEDGAPKELGLIAQEVEQVFPGLVQEDLSPLSDEDPTLYKQLKGSVLPVILLKALQEAAEKIETLEAKVAALESA